MSYSQPFQVECFYSCDKKLAMDVLTGKKDLKKSTNLWDWLGNGVYFWEQNPSRAWEYASENSKGDQFNKWIFRYKVPHDSAVKDTSYSGAKYPTNQRLIVISFKFDL